MTKKLLIGIMVFFLLSPLIFSEEIDTVILLDTSESMLPYFQSTVDYLIGDIIRNQLKIGDTFNLLTFDSKPNYEMSRKLKSEKDIQDILARILLLQPFGKYTDLVSAIVYVNNYTIKLPISTKKKIIILTDGVNDPPPGSMYNNIKSYSGKIKTITDNMIRQGWDVSLIRFPLKQVGSKTLNENSTSQVTDGSDVFTEISKNLNSKIIQFEGNNSKLSHQATGDPQIIFPGTLGSVKRSFTIPFIIKNYNQSPVQLRLKKILYNNNNILQKETDLKVGGNKSGTLEAFVQFPSSLKQGDYSFPVTLVFSDDMRPYPRSGTISFNLVGSTHNGFLNSWIVKIILFFIITIFILLLLLLIIKKYFVKTEKPAKLGRKYQKENESYHITEQTQDAEPLTRFPSRGKQRRIESDAPGTPSEMNKFTPFISLENKADKELHPNEEPGVDYNIKDVSHSKIHRKDITRKRNAEKGEKAYELVVDTQNRRIGLRNIHWFENGTTHSLGGDQTDDFLIFIHSVDRHIAEIVMENNVLYMKIIKKEYFPGITSDKILLSNKIIQLRVYDNHFFNLEFREWIPSLEKINRILHLIDKPGTPDFTY